jgi:hypothetical protein
VLRRVDWRVWERIERASLVGDVWVLVIGD